MSDPEGIGEDAKTMNMLSKNRHIGDSNPPPQPDQTFTATPSIIPSVDTNSQLSQTDSSSVTFIVSCTRTKNRSTVARLSMVRAQFVEGTLQLFKLLSRLAEFAFRRQALVVG